MKTLISKGKVFKPVKLNIDVDEKLYLKDPDSSELGLEIVRHSIELIDDIGFESFTFKKLAARIGATAPSVYRYFESKHKLLLYLLAWYWNYMATGSSWPLQILPRRRIGCAVPFSC